MSSREVLLHADADDLAESMAGRLATTIVERVEAAGLAHVVLTGGGIGTRVLAELRSLPAADAIDWSRVHLWWGDERWLPTGDPERNETSARAALLDAVTIPIANVHPMPGPDASASPEAAADAYAAELARFAQPTDRVGVPEFDIVMLGIGEDAHVASLFPEAPALHVMDRPVVAVHGAPKPPPTRITLTFPAINAAAQAWILASGADKAQAIRLALDPIAGPLQAPAAGVDAQLRTLICTDHAAADKLPKGLARPSA